MEVWMIFGFISGWWFQGCWFFGGVWFLCSFKAHAAEHLTAATAGNSTGVIGRQGSWRIDRWTMNKKRGYMVVVWVILFWGGIPIGWWNQPLDSDVTLYYNDHEIARWIPFIFLSSSVAEMGPACQKGSREGASFVSLIGGEPIFHILTIVMDF